HEQLDVIVELLNGQNRPQAEVRMAYANAGMESGRDRLILVGIRKVRFFADAAAAMPAPVRIGAEVRERRLRAQERGGHLLDQFRRNLVNEARGVGRLILAEDPAPSRGGQHETPLRPRNADVTE